MRVLIIAALVSLNAGASCTLDLKLNNNLSEKYYLVNGESLSTDAVMKLFDICKLNIEVMNKKQKLEYKIRVLEFKLNKAKQKLKE